MDFFLLKSKQQESKVVGISIAQTQLYIVLILRQLTNYDIYLLNC